jgi:uncharacterized membrane protein
VTALDVLAATRNAGAAARAPGDPNLYAATTTTINRRPDEVYAAWRDLERLPTFMSHLRSVQVTGDGRSHWVANAPAGRTVEWDAEIAEDVPGHRLAWHSLPGAAVDNSGAVTFTPAPGGRGTELAVDLRFRVPGGPVGELVAKLFGEEPSQQIKDDVRRFKQVLETGEVVRSEGSPGGTDNGVLRSQQPAQSHA